MTPLALIACVVAAGQAGKADADALVKDARIVAAAVVESARGKAGAKDDELTARYVRAAAAAAGRLPEKTSGAAFALALGVTLDTSNQMRNNLVVAATWRRVE